MHQIQDRDLFPNRLDDQDDDNQRTWCDIIMEQLHMIVVMTVAGAILLPMMGNIAWMFGNVNPQDDVQEREISRIRGYLNENIEPCENVLEFACGSLDSYAHEKLRLQDMTMKQLVELYSEPIRSYDHKITNTIKTAFKTCVTEPVKDTLKANVKTLKAALIRAGGWPILERRNWDEKKFNWLEATYVFRNLGYNYEMLINFSLIASPKDNGRMMLKVSLNKKPTLIGKETMTKVAALFGINKQLASREIDNINKYMTELTSNYTSFSDSAIFSIAQYQQKVNTVDWLRIINNIIGPDVKFGHRTCVIFDLPNIMNNRLNYLSAIPKRILANYMMWKMLEDISPDLLFDTTTKYGTAAVSKYFRRSIACINRIHQATRRVTNPMHVLYLRNYLSANKFDMVHNIVSKIHTAFIKVVHGMRWKDNHSRNQVRDAVDKIAVVVGAPENHFHDQIFDYINIELAVEDYQDSLTLMLQIRRRYENLIYNSVGCGIEYKYISWNMQEVSNSILSNDYVENTIELPAMILQGFLFDEEREHFYNYGYLGTLIANQFANRIITGLMEISEIDVNDGVYSQVTLYGIQEELVNRYTETIDRLYESKNKRFIEENARLPLPRTNINQLKRDLSLFITYTAYKYEVPYNWMSRGRTARYNGKQLFWISALRAFCGNRGEKFKRQSGRRIASFIGFNLTKTLESYFDCNQCNSLCVIREYFSK